MKRLSLHARLLALGFCVALAGCGAFDPDVDDLTLTTEDDAAEQAAATIDESNYQAELERIEKEIAQDERGG